MLSKNCLFFVLVGLFLSSAAIAADGWQPTYLIKVDMESLDRASIRSVERDGGRRLGLASRSGSALFLHASEDGLEFLSGLGAGFEVITRMAFDLEYYLVDRGIGVEDAISASGATVLGEGDTYYVLSVAPSDAYLIHLLPSKKNLSPTQPAMAPFRLGERAAAPPSPIAFTYSPAVKSMVDSVSEARLYDMLEELSGETDVMVGGEIYRFDTRYSPTALCKVAGRYLRERYEALGLETDFHYFMFRKTLKSVHFPDGNALGWAVGKGGIILHTDDAGEVWEKQDCPVDLGLNSVLMLDGYTGFIAGNEGTVLWTTDGGVTWTEAYTPTSMNLNGVFFLDGSSGYCCGDGGVILKSTDGGLNWSSQASGTGADLFAVAFVSSDEGWAVGAGGTIIHTVDSGASWDAVSSPSSADLQDVAFAGEDNGWIPTSVGKVLRTTDGSSWQEVATPVSVSLRSVCFAPDGTTGWACGTEGGVIKTYDGGASWGDLSIFSAPPLWDIWFVDNNEGWLVGSAQMLHSRNGGHDWDNESPNIRAGELNVVAEKRGTTHPEEIYIICGHYDSISNRPSTDAPGADDNGTGALAAVEAARALRAYDFEATIRFIGFTREEQGLVGSNAYANMVAQRGDSVVGVLNFDMIGYVDAQPEEVEILYDGNSADLANAYDQAAALYVPTLDCRLRFSPEANYSDHASFWDHGYPAFCGIEDAPPVNPYYHKTTDRLYTIDFDFYGDVVRAAIATLAELARIDTTSSGVPATAAVDYVKVFPNPCVHGASIRMAGGAGSELGLEIYDVRGRLVSRLQPQVRDGLATAYWDAQDETGRPLSPGIYFLRFAGTQEHKKVILLR